MKTIITDKCKELMIHAYKGVKLALKGYCFLIDNAKVLNEINEKTGVINPNKLKSDEELEDILLSDIIKNDKIVYNPRKNGRDLLDKLFDFTYTPNLELKSNTGDPFGSYDIKFDRGLDTYAPKGFITSDYTGNSKGFDAILIIGEKYTEDNYYVKGTNRSFLAAMLIPDGPDDFVIKADDENKTIGILLSTDKNETIVKYTLPEDNQTIFSSEFRLTIPTEEEFISVIENEKKNLELV